ncbi:MAG: hypothetical protein KKA42_14795 [candidate division Zixibacteria bacterium]|nr:hypothetical protein [candidate division Zixibacteria bacterium]
MKSARTFLTIALLTLYCPLSVLGENDGAVDRKLVEDFHSKLMEDGDPGPLINAVTNNNIKDLALNRKLLLNRDDLWAIKLDGSKIINQKSTGRCWMFAGSNVVTPTIIEELDLDDFKLSKAHLAFWDKIEKSNRFLERMIELRDRPLDDFLLSRYIESPVGDGGWWHYFNGLMQKYGVMPAAAMPETKQSSATGRLNALLTSKLRQATAEIRRMHTDGKKVKQLREYKEDVLAEVYRLLVYTYGTPPEEFTFRYTKEVDSVKTIVEESFTPMSFYERFYATSIPPYVALTHNPAMAMNTLYLLEESRNIQEKPDFRVLNLPIEKLKAYTAAMLKDSQYVWFACDVGRDNYNDSGLFAVDIYDYNTTLKMDFKLGKADRIRYQDMSPNHAMVISGLDTTSTGQVAKWRVENSWGSDKGESGYWTMYDSWFDENVLLVMIDPALLSPDDAAGLEQKPVVIEDWKPFFRAMLNLE